MYEFTISRYELVKRKTAESEAAGKEEVLEMGPPPRALKQRWIIYFGIVRASLNNLVWFQLLTFGWLM